MSKTQDDLDQVKYLFYRAITLLMAYTAPAYVLLWWISEPFIGVVYGTKWIEAGAPMSILTLAGFFLNVALPCSVLLAVRNRLGKEMIATAINMPIMIGGCVIGLRWGLEGVAWGLVLAQAVLAAQFYALVLRALPTRLTDLLQAVGPGLLLSALLFAFLAIIDFIVGRHLDGIPALYVLVMSVLAVLFYGGAFLMVPLRALESEAGRWRKFAASRLPFRRASGS